jgi:hypothetical protein
MVLDGWCLWGRGEVVRRQKGYDWQGIDQGSGRCAAIPPPPAPGGAGGQPPQNAEDADPWTTIISIITITTFSYAASDVTTPESPAGVGVGHEGGRLGRLWSVGGPYAHDFDSHNNSGGALVGYGPCRAASMSWRASRACSSIPRPPAARSASERRRSSRG